MDGKTIVLRLSSKALFILTFYLKVLKALSCTKSFITALKLIHVKVILTVITIITAVYIGHYGDE